MRDATKERRGRWSSRLDQMRIPGQRRARKGQPSDSLRPLLVGLVKDSVIIDLGCGNSGDRFVARREGFRAFGIDIFPVVSSKDFAQADVLKLPFADSTIDGISCHAVLDLISPVDRCELFQEAARVLRPMGLFSMTPYPLTDGFGFKMAIEDERAYDAGLHKLHRGVYMRCADPNCNEHPAPDSWEAIRVAAYRMDTDEGFRKIAPLLIAWIAKGGSFNKTVEFTGCNPDYLHFILRRLVDCGIFDAGAGVLDLPWMDYFMEDKVEEGNLALILDVLCIQGFIERSYADDDKKPRYKSLESA